MKAHQRDEKEKGARSFPPYYIVRDETLSEEHSYGRLDFMEDVSAFT